jgi:hypothetical protein
VQSFLLVSHAGGPFREQENATLIDMAFLSHTGQDSNPYKTDLLVEAVHNSLRAEKTLTFFDVDNIWGGDIGASKIETSVKLSRIFVAIISPSYLKRFWCMRELDIALNEIPHRPGTIGGRGIITVILGLDRNVLEHPPPDLVDEWARMALDGEGSGRVFVDVTRWKRNLQMLNSFQPIFLTCTWIVPERGDIPRFAQRVTACIKDKLPFRRGAMD